MSKKIALIAPVFPPIKISASVQLRDLAKEFCKQGFKITVIVPSEDICNPYDLKSDNGVDILRLRVFKSRDTNYLKRTISELLMPYQMIRNYKKIKIHSTDLSGIVWYSPPIFLSPFIKYLMKKNSCLNYLILRDIFPEWALNLGLLKMGIIFKFFKFFENQQYKIANIIGIQSEGNLKYFHRVIKGNISTVEVLHNWLHPSTSIKTSINFSTYLPKDKKIVVYSGNMGVAQDLDIFIDLAAKMQKFDDVCFLFIGRGSNKKNMIQKAKLLNITNILFFEEIDPKELNSLLDKCHVGLLSLDRRHKTQNIPGKFLTYLNRGLPVFALINKNNDLHAIIKKHNVGYSTSNYSINSIEKILTKQLNEVNTKISSTNCKNLYKKMFLPKKAVEQIIRALKI